MAMTPQTGDDLRQDFVIGTLPSRTFKMNYDRLTVSGTIDQVQAVEQSVYLILNTERYEWLIHSWNYGVELHNLIGKDVEFCIPEIERRVREALLQDDRITAVQDFQFEVNKKKVLTTFTVVSIFGAINTEMEVEI
jgi:phage baseplate assembly protein W